MLDIEAAGPDRCWGGTTADIAQHLICLTMVGNSPEEAAVGDMLNMYRQGNMEGYNKSKNDAIEQLEIEKIQNNFLPMLWGCGTTSVSNTYGLN